MLYLKIIKSCNIEELEKDFHSLSTTISKSYHEITDVKITQTPISELNEITRSFENKGLIEYSYHVFFKSSKDNPGVKRNNKFKPTDK